MFTTARSQRSGVNSEAFAAKYSSNVLWKSRWSWVRLVNPATAKRAPSTRPSASAWLDTSIAHQATAFSRITANNACRSVASGVVRTLLTTSSPIRVSIVPTSAVWPIVRNTESSR